nr:MAG TPA: hypothetical protein [Bacteriophage sp.]
MSKITQISTTFLFLTQFFPDFFFVFLYSIKESFEVKLRINLSFIDSTSPIIDRSTIHNTLFRILHHNISSLSLSKSLNTSISIKKIYPSKKRSKSTYFML